MVEKSSSPRSRGDEGLTIFVSNRRQTARKASGWCIAHCGHAL